MGNQYGSQAIHHGLRNRGKYQNVTLKALLSFLHSSYTPETELEHILKYTIQRLLHWYVLIFMDRKKCGRFNSSDISQFLTKYVNTLDKDFTQVKVDHLRDFLLQQLLVEDVRFSHAGMQRRGRSQLCGRESEYAQALLYEPSLGDNLSQIKESGGTTNFYRFRKETPTIHEIARHLIRFVRDLNLPDEEVLPGFDSPTSLGGNKTTKQASFGGGVRTAIAPKNISNTNNTTEVSAGTPTSERNEDSAYEQHVSTNGGGFSSPTNLNPGISGMNIKGGSSPPPDTERRPDRLIGGRDLMFASENVTAPHRASPVLIEDQVDLLFRLLARDAFDLTKTERDKLLKALEYHEDPEVAGDPDYSNGGNEAGRDDGTKRVEECKMTKEELSLLYPGETLYSAKKLELFLVGYLLRLRQNFLWEDTLKKAKVARNDAVAKGKISVALCQNEQWTMGTFLAAN